MNRKLEMIVANRDSAMEELNEFEKMSHVFENLGFNAAQINSMRTEKREVFAKANADFWKAFEFTLEIFDLSNGECPNLEELVYVYDEIDHEWIEVQPSSYPMGGEMRFVKGLRVLGSPNEHDRYHRWTRMPILKRD